MAKKKFTGFLYNMKINSCSNINFNGYRSVISYADSGDGFDVKYMFMQLNNYGKNNDLDKFECIQKLIGDYESCDDILTLTSSKDASGHAKVYIDNFPIPDDSDLKMYRKIVSDKQFFEFENLVLKIYDFLVDITNRLAAEDVIESDNNTIARGFAKYLSFDKKRLTNSEIGEFIRTVMNDKTPLKYIASDFNQTLINRMKNYFL